MIASGPSKNFNLRETQDIAFDKEAVVLTASPSCIIPSSICDSGSEVIEQYIENFGDSSRRIVAIKCSYLAADSGTTNAVDAPRRNDYGKAVSRFCLRASKEISDKAGWMNAVSKRFFFQPGIPQDRLRGALEAFSNLRAEEIRMLIDDTLTGNGKNGVVMTDRAIYAKAMLGAPVCVEFGDITSIEFKASLLAPPSIIINGQELFSFAQVSKESVKKLVELLSDLCREKDV